MNKKKISNAELSLDQNKGENMIDYHRLTSQLNLNVGPGGINN